ncbi:hypothetical protein [Antrihabitans spumae]|uniref:Uncharacterized protein n=1 Tax=Antrihabitans spumae TaxID=3373370 RepID=A0ABW7KT29_9NOCA
MSETSAPRTLLASTIRVLAALTVIGSSVAVTALTVERGDQVAVVVPQAQTENAVPAAAVVPAPAPPAAVPPPAAPAPGGPAPSAAVPLGGPSAAAPAVTIKPGTTTPGTTPSTPGAPGSVPLGTAPPGTGSPFETAPVNTQPPCPLGWPAPAKQGGLASLIGLAPLAGPFSSEAFALGSVYQPLLQLVGPVLAEIAPVIDANLQWINPIITQVQGVEAVVLEAILPYYGPYRAQLINAEGEFAKLLTPILDRVYNSEAASCFVAWQGQVIDQAKGGRISVASLAHPGTVVELGPEQ